MTKELNRYEQKQADRKARQAARAAKLRAQADEIHARTRRELSAIPFGQPILVGHHSEGRHRRLLARAQASTSKAFGIANQADELARRAATESNAISSDDEDAVTKLQAKLTSLEAAQTKMVAANKCVRKGDRAGLVALGFTEQQAEDLFKPDLAGRIGFASYALSNNNANIHATKARLARLQKVAQERQAIAAGEKAAPEPKNFTGGKLVEDIDDNRLCLIFDAKPAAPIIAELKGRGFKWSPSRGAWVRMLNNTARYQAAFVIQIVEAAA